MLCAVILSGAFVPGAAQAKTTEETRVEKVRASLLKREAKQHVEIRLMNDTKLKGYVSNVGQDAFNFTDRKTGATTTVALADVKKVSSPALLSNRTKWIITASAVAAGAVALYAARGAFCDGQC